MKILLLHAYSATNLGDGLLVEESIELLTEAFPSATVTVAALHPSTFNLDPPTVVRDVSIGPRGFGKDLRLLNQLDRYDLVVGVGGGYLRAGRPVETAKTALAHLPQLFAAAHTSTPTIYLPQSVGPLRGGAQRVARHALSRIDRVYLRDDVSMRELGLPNTRRVPDLALLRRWAPRPSEPPVGPTVLSVRKVHGSIPEPVHTLSASLESFDGYVQSRGAGNEDYEAMLSIGPQRLISQEELLSGAPRRVVIAVRLHAALMALHAGHYVIHLSYERKGFGAFSDLGLSDYVHNVNTFQPSTVREQATLLHTNAHARDTYDRSARSNSKQLTATRHRIIDDLRRIKARHARQ